MSEFQTFMGKVGTDTSLIRAANYPNQQSNYYQVTWEPSLGWADSDANFVAMYKAAYQGIHSTDPNAVVMGTGQSVRRELRHLHDGLSAEVRRARPVELHRRGCHARVLERGHVSGASA